MIELWNSFWYLAVLVALVTALVAVTRVALSPVWPPLGVTDPAAVRVYDEENRRERRAPCVTALAALIALAVTCTLHYFLT